jgi:hypothetical protein
MPPHHEPHSAADLEEEMETGHDVPMCLSDCTCYPDFEGCHKFDKEDGQGVCDFINNEIYPSMCSDDCDAMVQGFISHIHMSACSGAWPMPEMKEEHHEPHYDDHHMPPHDMPHHMPPHDAHMPPHMPPTHMPPHDAHMPPHMPTHIPPHDAHMPPHMPPHDMTSMPPPMPADATYTNEPHPNHEPHSAAELEEEMETGHDVPMCLEDCTCYPDFENCHKFDIMDGKSVCEFLDHEIYPSQCSMDCDSEVQGFISHIHMSACTGAWPMPEMMEDEHHEPHYDEPHYDQHHMPPHDMPHHNMPPTHMPPHDMPSLL